jgi:hypothetical protein
LSDHSSVAAIEDGYSSSTRHVVKDGGFIEMQTETPNAGIYFTLDGANPIDGAGSTKELVGAPWIKAWDSVRVYSGPIQSEPFINCLLDGDKTKSKILFDCL